MSKIKFLGKIESNFPLVIVFAVVALVILPWGLFAQETPIDRYNRTMELFRKNQVDDYRTAASAAFEAAKLSDAAMFAAKHLKKVPDDTATVLLMAQAYLWSGVPEKASGAYERYFRLGGKRDCAVVFQYAECIRSLGCHGAAIAHYFESRSKAATAETEILARINLALGYCYLETRDFGKASRYFSRVDPAVLPAEKSEALGDYHNKLYSLETSETVYNPKSGSLEKYVSKKHLEKALRYYKTCRGKMKADADRTWINVKIIDAIWELGQREKALRLMKKIEPGANSEYAAMRLSYFLRETGGSDEVVLGECLRLLNKARKISAGNKAEIDYEIAAVFGRLGDAKARKESLLSASRLIKGGEWFVFDLFTTLNDLNAGAGVLKTIHEKTGSAKANREASVLMEAFICSVADDAPGTIAAIGKFLEMKAEDKNFDRLSFCRKTFDSLKYEIRISNSNILNSIEGKMKELDVAEVKKKIAALDNFISGADDRKDLAGAFELKSAICSAAGKFADAVACERELLEIYRGGTAETALHLKNIYNLSVGSADTAAALKAAKALFDNGIYEKQPLTDLIYSNYWDGERALAERCLEKLATIDKRSPVVSTFAALKFQEAGRHRSSLRKLREAISFGGDPKYIGERICESRNKLGAEPAAGYSYISDSSGSSQIVRSVSSVLPQDGYNLSAGAIVKEFTKNQVFQGTRSLKNHLSEYFLGGEWTGGPYAFAAKIVALSADRALGPVVTKVVPYIKVSRQSGNYVLSFTYQKGFVEDTPLSLELGLTSAVTGFSVDYSKNKYFWSVSLTGRKLSDGNSRNTFAVSAGRHLRKSLSLRLQYSKDSMDHEYSGTGDIGGEAFFPFEVYYSPRKVEALGLGLEYSRQFGRFMLRTAVTPAGFEKRENGPDSKYRNLSLSIERRIAKEGMLSLSFYGAKSDVDPFSAQDEKTKYIGRETYLKYSLKY